MTPEQAKRLVACDPGHFYKRGKTTYFKRFSFGETLEPLIYFEVYWWMLSELPIGTDLGWQDNIGKFACRPRTKEGWDVGNGISLAGFGDTREEALIECYIKWKEEVKV